ncbi:MAG: hypothetical protein HY646_09845 [Acidobacteria bacterium]|nr:hypothetical protein [Acidobacteriota bacterium]
MRIKWTSLPDWVNKTDTVAPSFTRDREALDQALKREGKLDEHKKAKARVRERIRRWFKED